MDLQTILIGAAGGAIVLILEQVYVYFRDKSKAKQKLLVSFPNSERKIDKNIFEKLSPGHSIEFMKASLGTPDKKFIESEPAFKEYREEEEGLMVYEFPTEEDRLAYEEKKFDTTAYFYDFKNAQVKITSKDNETIDSLAVEVKEGTLDVTDLPLGFISEDEDSTEKILLASQGSKVETISALLLVRLV